MRSPRVFISHSNQDPEALAFLDRLSRQLQEQGFDVLVDRDRLKPGSRWRDEIYTWLGLCHASVILLSENVFEADSLWVARETSILLWRKTLDPKFPIIPILMDQVTPLHLSKGNFRDLNFSEIQVVPTGPSDESVQSVLQALENLHWEEPTPLEEMASQVAALLRNLDDEVVVRAAETLGIDLGPWDPMGNPRKSLALKMLQVDLRKAVDALEYIADYMENETIAERILAIIAPSWVDLCAARWIPDCALARGVKPVVVLNAGKKSSADMYVRRACCRTPKTMWPVMAVSGMYGEMAEDELIAEIEEALQRQFRLEKDPFEQDTRERLRELLRARDEQGKPVFIVFRLSPQVSGFFSSLQSAFPTVTLFVLTGEEFPDASALGAVPARFLEPRLRPGDEKRAQTDYDYAVSVIRPR